MDIDFNSKQHIGMITLQRVDALNALSLPMVIALQQQLYSWQSDNDIHAVIISSASDKAFCAGGDILSLYHSNYQQQMQFFWHEYRLNHFIHKFNKPYIALMDGLTMGGGVGIALHGSHPVASPRFVFAMPETGIGFFPDVGSSYLLARCPDPFGVYLALSGQRIDASSAYALGLVRYLIPDTSMRTIVHELMQTDLSEDAFARVDECLQRYTLSNSSTEIMQLQPLLKSCFDHLGLESILAQLAAIDDMRACELLNILDKKSPLSLKVSLELLARARSMNLAECLKMDYCVAANFMRSHDFYEGVRALLLDKDKSPHWRPAALAEISDASMLAYFECGQDDLVLLD